MLHRVFLVTLAIISVARAAVSGPVDVLLVADSAALQPLVDKLAQPEKEEFGAWTIWRGSLAGKTVALARSEGDSVNAVAATTFAMRRCPPRLIVTFGSARAFDEALRPGDIVIAERFTAMDGMVSDIVPIGGGSRPLQWKPLPHALMTAGEKEVYVDSFPADAAALNIALNLPEKHRVARGILGSTPQINREADRIAQLRALWHASTEDGESAFIAGCAALFACPVTGFRIVDGSPEDAASFALKFLEALR
jgi:adenosylhomocysteine nucleosidase